MTAYYKHIMFGIILYDISYSQIKTTNSISRKYLQPKIPIYKFIRILPKKVGLGLRVVSLPIPFLV